MELFTHLLAPTDGSPLSREAAERTVFIVASVRNLVAAFLALVVLKPMRRRMQAAEPLAAHG